MVRFPLSEATSESLAEPVGDAVEKGLQDELYCGEGMRLNLRPSALEMREMAAKWAISRRPLAVRVTSNLERRAKIMPARVSMRL